MTAKSAETPPQMDRKPPQITLQESNLEFIGYTENHPKRAWKDRYRLTLGEWIDFEPADRPPGIVQTSIHTTGIVLVSTIQALGAIVRIGASLLSVVAVFTADALSRQLHAYHRRRQWRRWSREAADDNRTYTADNRPRQKITITTKIDIR
jgi:hypothetical protein